MPGPSFICPGAQKAGTTWLHRQLRQHPQFWMPPQKEIDYLGQFPVSRQKYLARLPNALERLSRQKNGATRAAWWRLFTSEHDLGKYTRLFDPAGKKFSGDVSPNYSSLDAAGVQQAAQIVPDAKIILLLRDPAKRAWSHARHAISHRPTKDATEEERTAAMVKFATSKRCFNNGDYARIVTDWRSAFGENSVYIGYYDDLTLRPVELLNGILDFLGADSVPSEQEASLTDVINKGTDVVCPSALSADLAQVYAPMLEKLRPMLPQDNRPDWV